MKRYHIFILVFLAISTGVMITMFYSGPGYANFSDAMEHEEKEFTVTGKLNKNKPIHYNPQINPNLVVFYMTDRDGVESKVILNDSKPLDLESSEAIALTGRYKNDAFYAGSILLKCPSKYENEPGMGKLSSKK